MPIKRVSNPTVMVSNVGSFNTSHIPHTLKRHVTLYEKHVNYTDGIDILGETGATTDQVPFGKTNEFKKTVKNAAPLTH